MKMALLSWTVLFAFFSFPISCDTQSSRSSTFPNCTISCCSAVSFLQLYKFDVLHLDWEYPSTAADKIGFANLIVALKNAFVPNDYVKCWSFRLVHDAGYDVPQMAQNSNFINLMSYDFQGSSWEPTTADHHSPLRMLLTETNNLGTDFAVMNWISKGMPPAEINMGIPLYGTPILSAAVEGYSQFKSKPSKL